MSLHHVSAIWTPEVRISEHGRLYSYVHVPLKRALNLSLSARLYIHLFYSKSRKILSEHKLLSGSVFQYNMGVKYKARGPGSVQKINSNLAHWIVGSVKKGLSYFNCAFMGFILINTSSPGGDRTVRQWANFSFFVMLKIVSLNSADRRLSFSTQITLFSYINIYDLMYS